MICNIDNIATYPVPHDSANVLGEGLSSTSIVEKVGLVGWEAKNNACRYFKAMGQGVNLVFYTSVIVEGIAVEVAELIAVPL